MSKNMLPKDKEISPEEIAEKIKNGERLIFLDVRREENYKKGHIKGAINIPLIDLSSERLEESGIKKDSEIIVYCQRGERSETACEMLIEWGYKIRHLSGGLEGWPSGLWRWS